MASKIGIAELLAIKKQAKRDGSIFTFPIRCVFNNRNNTYKVLGYYKFNYECFWKVCHIDYATFIEDKELYDTLEEAVNRYNEF